MKVILTSGVLAAALMLGGPVQAQSLDCLAPAPDATPGTTAWTARDVANVACAEQSLGDTALNPLINLGSPYPLSDLVREPVLYAGKRFRYDATTVRNRGGTDLPVDILRPCTVDACTDIPSGLKPLRGPYPTVLVVHGGASNRQLHWWATEALAEAGYMAVAFDVAENTGGDHATDAQDVLDWLFSAQFPFASDLNKDRVGIAGHSQGASTASLLGQIDSRLLAIVAWDNLTALKFEWSDDIGVDPPSDVTISKPALGIGADYYFVPVPNPTSPEPPLFNGEGGRGRGFQPHIKDAGYQELRAAGVDTMLFVLRAGTHLDFTPTTATVGSRYGQAVSTYLTLAWFDRYLRGLDDRSLADDGFRRLLHATVFDGSADQHSLSVASPVGGMLDIPAKIAGLSICDRMSFYFKSRYALRAPGSTELLNSEDWLTECRSEKPGGESLGPQDSGGGVMGWFALVFLALAVLISRRQGETMDRKLADSKARNRS